MHEQSAFKSMRTKSLANSPTGKGSINHIKNESLLLLSHSYHDA